MPHVYGPTYRHVLDDVRARFAAGEREEDIARELGVSERTVRTYTEHLPQRDPKREARRLQVLACLEAGLHVRAVAAKASCKVAHVVNILKSARAAEPIPEPTPEMLEAARVDRRAKARARYLRRKVEKSAIA